MSSDKLNTYQELMARFGVSYATICRWFKAIKKVSPSLRTIRIPEKEVQKFIKRNTRINATKTK